jgi:citrate lyase subunit beta/citryl-CoA lyase
LAGGKTRWPKALSSAPLGAFAWPEYVERSVIALDGRMVERLHLAHVEKLLAKLAVPGS